MAMVRAGVPVLVLPMPLSGTTAPMTVLGTMIVNVAELLSAVVLFQLARPGCGIISGMGAGVADMRSGLYLCGTPECALMNVIGIEMSHFYGLPCTGSAITCDAKASNQQAGAEGMLTGAACALAGADTILAFGCSDGAQSLSFAKVVLDCDSVGALRRLVREDPIDATRALIDDIAAVGIGGHYLGRRSTRRVPPGRRGVAAGALAARAVRAVRGAAARRRGRRSRRGAPGDARSAAAARRRGHRDRRDHRPVREERRGTRRARRVAGAARGERM